VVYLKVFRRFRKYTEKYNEYDVTIFQTPQFGQKKGYRQVYRFFIHSTDHETLISQVFRMFNVQDLVPKDYRGRYLGTGDIVFIDEGRNGHYYYQLQTGGWRQIHRVHLRLAKKQTS
jgi:hypothetical protein